MARKNDNIDQRMLGDEPLPQHYSGTSLTRALNWYSYYSDSKTNVEWVSDYLKSMDYNNKAITAFKKVKNVPQSVASIARILSVGGTVDDDVKERFKEKLVSLVDSGLRMKEDITPDVPTKSPQDYLNEKIDDTIAYIENELDENLKNGKTDFDTYGYLQSIEGKSIYGKRVMEYFSPVLEEVSLAINKTDDEVTEAYLRAFGGVRKLKKHQKFLESIVADAKRFALNQKKTRVRKRRKTKVKSAIDLVKNVNYKKEDKDLKLVSTNPANIVGAKSLWTFNTKYRQLTVYNAVDGGTLTVKGSTLKNFDEKTSITKKIRENKVNDLMPKVLNGGKVVLRKLMSGIRAKVVTPSGRLNKETILLRVTK